MNRILAGTVLAAALAGALPALAEAPPARLLRGVPAVDLVVEDPGAAAMRCGIRRQHLESSLRTLLATTPVRHEPAAEPYLYLRGLFLSSHNECLYTLSLELRGTVSVDDTGASGVASIWRSSVIQAVAITEAEHGIASAVSALVDHLAADWSVANPTR
jgi:hypothetical protein